MVWICYEFTNQSADSSCSERVHIVLFVYQHVQCLYASYVAINNNTYLGVGNQFCCISGFVYQDSADAILEVSETLKVNKTFGNYFRITLLSCAFAGSGNVHQVFKPFTSYWTSRLCIHELADCLFFDRSAIFWAGVVNIWRQKETTKHRL